MQKYPARANFTVPKGTKSLWKEAATAQGISLSELLRRTTREDRLKTL
jgi:hypothetical protein